jgi:hypothetical protein
VEKIKTRVAQLICIKYINKATLNEHMASHFEARKSYTPPVQYKYSFFGCHSELSLQSAVLLKFKRVLSSLVGTQF